MSQQYTDNEIKSVFIYQFGLNIEWESEEDMENFKIAVYGNDNGLYSELKKFSGNQLLKGKPIKVMKFGKISELLKWNPQIVYLSEFKNFEIKSVFDAVYNKNILLVSDNSYSDKYIMINFIYPKDKKLGFEINKKNIVDNNLKILPKLLLLGGTQYDINELFKEQEKRIIEQKQKVYKLQKKSENQKKIIAKLNAEINKKLNEITVQKKEIEMLNKLIIQQKDTLQIVENNINNLKNDLNLKTEELLIKNKKINQNEQIKKIQNKQIIENKKTLTKLAENIARKQEKIKLQEKELSNQSLKLKKQRNLLISAVVVVLIILVLLILLIFNILSKQKINKILIYRNLEIEEKNRQIQKQADELIQHRNRLEQLVEERTRELQAAKLKAEESDRLKTAFLANMSHEIRTPMNAVIGFANLLYTNDYEKNKRKELVKYILKSSEMLLSLINDIIDISKIEAGQLKIYKSEFYLNDFLSDVAILYEEKIKQNKNIKLVINKNKSNEKIYTDKIRLQQVLINLIDNALKFTEKGIITVESIIMDTDDEKELKFSVSDTGKGMTTEQQKHIFNRFIKLEEENDKLYRGAGLGLSISKNIVELLGGKIWLNSEKNKGTTFYFTVLA